jgi:hypothetical protein
VFASTFSLSHVSDAIPPPRSPAPRPFPPSPVIEVDAVDLHRPVGVVDEEDLLLRLDGG